LLYQLSYEISNAPCGTGRKDKDLLFFTKDFFTLFYFILKPFAVKESRRYAVAFMAENSLILNKMSEHDAAEMASAR
jgi:hypothetical protein